MNEYFAQEVCDSGENCDSRKLQKATYIFLFSLQMSRGECTAVMIKILCNCL